jgi:hypothetical protein
MDPPCSEVWRKKHPVGRNTLSFRFYTFIFVSSLETSELRCFLFSLCLTYAPMSRIFTGIIMIPLLMYRYCVCLFVCFWRDGPQWAKATSFTKILDYTQQRTTVGRTPLDDWSARCRDFYLVAHNNHNKHPFHWWDKNPQFQQTSGRVPTYLLTPWSRVLLEKLTSELCS